MEPVWQLKHWVVSLCTNESTTHIHLTYDGIKKKKQWMICAMREHFCLNSAMNQIHPFDEHLLGANQSVNQKLNISG